MNGPTSPADLPHARRRRLLLAGLTAGLGAALPLRPATAAGKPIQIGQIADLRGPTASGSLETQVGAQACFELLNAQGGLGGRPLQLRSVDDGFDPERTRLGADALGEDPAVLALLLVRGTPNVEAILPALDRHRLPLVAPSTGAMSLRDPVHAQVFHVRASYQLEAERIVEHFHTVGNRRIALAAIGNSFGDDALQGAQRQMRTLGLQAHALHRFSPKETDLKPLAQALADRPGDAALLIGASGLVARLIGAARQLGLRTPIATLSNNASAGFIKELGAHAHGVIVSQAFPYERAANVPLVAEAREAAQRFGGATLTPSVLEGYAGAKVLIEGLRRAGPRPTRASLRDALEKLGDFDLGGPRIHYSASSHEGMRLVEMSIISAEGRFLR